MQKKYLALTALLAVTLIAGCSNGITKTEAVASEPVSTEVVSSEVITNEVSSGTTDAIVIETEVSETEATEELVEVVAEEPVGTEAEEYASVSTLTGLPIKEGVLELRPAVVMLDNHYGARPQAGLNQADHVYEILAEGRITRYMAVFQSGSPSPVGPVRSARPYFIDRALEYDPYYVHVGGSMQAMTDIINLNMADIDGLSSGANVFWRTKHKRIPHNMYSSADAIRKESQRKGYRQSGKFEGMSFNEEIMAPEGVVCNYVKAVYKQPTARDKVGYYIEFNYNNETMNYERSVNGKKHLDENDDSVLTADNIIVQIATHKVIDDEGRRQISLIGQGKGYFITNGEKLEITWSKSDRYSRTIYKDQSGAEIKFNPGNTWFQVVEGENTLGW